MLDLPGSHQLLNSSHVRERDKVLLRSVMVGGVWNGFLLGKVRGEVVSCRFGGHLFLECPYPPLVEIRESPEFHDLMRMDKSHWPRCLLWHGWLPLLSGAGDGSPWAVSADDAAATCLRVLWVLIPLIFSRVGMSLRVLIGILLLMGCLLHLMFGLMVVLFVMRFLVLLGLVLVFMLACMLITGGTGVGGILMILVLLLMVCPLHVWVLALCLGPLQTVQRAEFWGVVFALQAANAVHLGVDNLNVVRHVGRLLKGLSNVRPLELVDDGDLIILIRKLLSICGEGTVYF